MHAAVALTKNKCHGFAWFFTCAIPIFHFYLLCKSFMCALSGLYAVCCVVLPWRVLVAAAMCVPLCVCVVRTAFQVILKENWAYRVNLIRSIYKIAGDVLPFALAKATSYPYFHMNYHFFGNGFRYDKFFFFVHTSTHTHFFFSWNENWRKFQYILWSTLRMF